MLFAPVFYADGYHTEVRHNNEVDSEDKP